MSRFRFSAKNFFLTYPQCPLQKDYCLAQLQLLFQNAFTHYMIAQEKHSDGSLHLHVFLKFLTRKNITRQDAFNLSQDATTYHPNVQPCRDVVATLRYLQKEDTSPLTNIKPGDLDGETLWTAVIAAPSSEEAEELIQKGDPKRYVNNFNNINAFLQNKKRRLQAPPPFSPKYSPTSFIIPYEVQVWSEQINHKLERCHLLILIGPPNIGKTALMRSFGPHAFIRGFWNIQPLLDTSSYNYIVMDDVLLDPAMLLPNRSILLGMDGGCSLTDKYTHKIWVDTGGKPAVIITNKEQVVDLFERDESYRGLFTVCRVCDRLFVTSSQIEFQEEDVEYIF